MHLLLSLLVLLGAVQIAPAAAAPSKRIEHFNLRGVSYVRLEDWAAAQHFSTDWVVPRQEFRVNTPTGPIRFFVDSPRISFRGIHVWMTRPVVGQDNQFYVPRTDTISTLQPLISPQLNSPKRRIKTIVLDPGHGGRDPGHRDGGRDEKRYTLLIATELKSILARHGFEVSLTRTSDAALELPDRAEIARRRGADLFISLHLNSWPSGPAVNGCEVYCLSLPYTPSTNSQGEGGDTGTCPGNLFDAKNVLLAYQLQKAAVTLLRSEDRGVKRARYAVLRSAEMPAVLVESAFMTNPVESQRINDPAWRRRVAEALASGVSSYRNLVEPAPSR